MVVPDVALVAIAVEGEGDDAEVERDPGAVGVVWSGEVAALLAVEPHAFAGGLGEGKTWRER